MNFLTYILCFCLQERKKFNGKLMYAQRQLERELDLEKFIKRQRMTTMAILGLLNRKQVFYTTKLTQLVAYDDERAVLQGESERSYSENEDMAKMKKTSRRAFTDRIAVDLVSSRDRVDKRLLKLHAIATD